MLRIRLRVLLACPFPVVPTLAPAQQDNAERLRIHGSNTMGAHLVPALVESWLQATGFEDIRRRARGPAMTRAAQEVVARAGHFATLLRPAPQPRLFDPAPGYRELVAGAQRLPLSLRFNPAGVHSVFDSRAVRDLDRIVERMQRREFHKCRAVVVAFGHPGRAGDIVSTLVSNERVEVWLP